MSNIENFSELGVTACDETIFATSNTVELEILDLSIVKSVSCPWTVVGGTVQFCVTITNPSDDMALPDAIFRDVLNDRLTYVEDTFTVDGHPETPIYNPDTNTLEYTIPVIEPNSSVTICFKVKVGAQGSAAN